MRAGSRKWLHPVVFFFSYRVWFNLSQRSPGKRSPPRTPAAPMPRSHRAHIRARGTGAATGEPATARGWAGRARAGTPGAAGARVGGEPLSLSFSRRGRG